MRAAVGGVYWPQQLRMRRRFAPRSWRRLPRFDSAFVER